jgi:hypothetical protein
MSDVGRLQLGFVFLVLGLAIGLGYLALRPVLRRWRGGSISPVPPGSPVYQRPIWLVVVLTMLSLGIYLHVWFGRSWSELTRVAGKPDMSTGSHL